jgi:uncharacterized protein (TIGR02453 family)
MISKEIFRFLQQLKKNNDKEWFDENRENYLKLKKEFEQFIDLVIAEISRFDKDAGQNTAKTSIFRINRDVRFSNDKSPYKTNFGAFVAKGGRKGINAGYYIHVEPGQCFLAGGIYMPSAPMLKAIREEIYENIDEFRKIIQAPAFVRHFGDRLGDDKLSSAPKGFPKDFPYIDYLKYKSYTVIKSEPDSLYHKADFIKEVRDVFTAMAPFNFFLNRAVEEVER